MSAYASKSSIASASDAIARAREAYERYRAKIRPWLPNQTPPLSDYNLFTTDEALQEAVAARRCRCTPRATGARRRRHRHGARASTTGGSPIAIRRSLQSFNVHGERIDRIEFHPSWHALMRGIAVRGYHSAPWALEDGRRARRARMPRARRATSCRRRWNAARCARPP